MFCPKCGAQNPDGSDFCYSCGSSLQNPIIQNNINNNQSKLNNQNYYQNSPYANQNVPNYLVQSILVTLFCCMPFGIAAIVFAAQVDNRLRQGDYNGAVDSSNKAKTCCIIAFVCGLIALGFYILSAIAQSSNY